MLIMADIEPPFPPIAEADPPIAEAAAAWDIEFASNSISRRFSLVSSFVRSRMTTSSVIPFEVMDVDVTDVVSRWEISAKIWATVRP